LLAGSKYRGEFEEKLKDEAQGALKQINQQKRLDKLALPAKEQMNKHFDAKKGSKNSRKCSAPSHLPAHTLPYRSLSQLNQMEENQWVRLLREHH
jgi:hypothetical protein